MFSPLSTRWSRGLLGLVLTTLAFESSARIDDDLRAAETWMENYHQRPDPDQFVTAIYAFSRSEYFAVPENVRVGIGFFASVFRQNPDYIDYWMTYGRLLPERERRLMISALWCAGHPKGQEYLDFYATQIVGESMGVQLLELSRSEPLLDDPGIHSRRGAYLKWGVFLATGDEALLRTLLQAMAEREDLTTQDRWWLACAASRHEEVMAFCEREIATSDAPWRDLLQLVVTARTTLPAS